MCESLEIILRKKQMKKENKYRKKLEAELDELSKKTFHFERGVVIEMDIDTLQKRQKQLWKLYWFFLFLLAIVNIVMSIGLHMLQSELDNEHFIQYQIGRDENSNP